MAVNGGFWLNKILIPPPSKWGYSRIKTHLKGNNVLRKMIESHPAASSFNAEELTSCISHCYSCAQICTTCADACLHEDRVRELTQCIRLNLDCADVCLATGAMLSRVGSVSEELVREQLRACRTACEICGQECGKHKQHEHCVICAESCRKCGDVCDQMLSAISAGV